MGNYTVSVITPFDGGDTESLKKTFGSLCRQTMGYDNIEWIIALFDPDAAKNAELKEMTDNSTNIRICTPEKRTANIPEIGNIGLKAASAPYVAFIYAGDTFEPQCLSTAVSCIRGSGTQMVWFRKMYEAAESGTRSFAEKVMWNQTYSEIIFDKSSLGGETLLSGNCGSVEARLFDKDFLDRCGICFDSTLYCGADIMFMLDTLAGADKVCCLPQMIGCCCGSGNTAYGQFEADGAVSVILVAKSLKKIFDKGLSAGMYMNDVISEMCFSLAHRMAVSDNLTRRDREAVKDILSPYAEQMRPLKVSKLYTEQDVRERYEFTKAVILDPDSYTGGYEKDTLIAGGGLKERLLSPYQRLLRSILSINSGTDIGEKYGFADIHTISEYQLRVDITDYDMYAPLLSLQTDIGESGVITSDSVRNYILDLGSMDNPRLLPCTERQFAPLKDALNEIFTGEKTFLLLESFPKKNRYKDNASVNTVYGSVLSDIFADESLSVYAKRAMFTAPSELLFPETVEDMTYLRLMFGLSERFVKQMTAPNTWELWETFRFLEKNWRELCADIESGSPDHFSRNVSDSFRESIRKSLFKDPGRAEELRDIFEQGFDTPIAPRIWKKLSKIYAFGDGTFGIYTENLRRYIGDIPLRNGFFAEAGALIGTETDVCGQYKLETSNAFVEFVPADGSAAAAASDVEAGKDYSLLISTYSGLYRYRLNDVVHIESLKHGMPVFSYKYNASQTMVLDGCEMTDELIGGCVKELRKASGTDAVDYAYMKNSENNGMTVMLEINNDNVSDLDMSGLSKEFEKIIEERSESYREAVSSGRIKPAEVKIIEQETQLFYREVIMMRIKHPSDLIKPVRYIGSPVKERFFRSRMIK